MVTQTEVNTYLASLYEEQSKYMDKLVLKEKLGKDELMYYRVMASLLNCYVHLIVDYFSQADYSTGYFDEDYNFFDVEEIKDIIFRVNGICDTTYYLDL